MSFPCTNYLNGFASQSRSPSFTIIFIVIITFLTLYPFLLWNTSWAQPCRFVYFLKKYTIFYKYLLFFICLWVDWAVFLPVSTGLTPVAVLGWQQMEDVPGWEQLDWLGLSFHSFPSWVFFMLSQSKGSVPRWGKAGAKRPLEAQTPELAHHDFICILLMTASPEASSKAQWKE